MSGDQQALRTPSLLDASCDAFVYDLAKLSPTLATGWGLPGHDGELEDFSPQHWDSVADRIREMIADLDALNDGTDDSDDEEDFDEVDQVTAEVLRESLCLELALHHNGEYLRMMNNIESPVQMIRDSFLMMPKDTQEHQDTIASRLSKVSAALDGYRESLLLADAHGKTPTERQVDVVMKQCQDLADAHSALETVGLPADHPTVVEAKKAFGDFAEWLGETLGPKATHEDAVGRERYQRFSQQWVGSVVDLDEAYEWGLDRLQEIIQQQNNVAATLYGPGTSIKEAFQKLNEDPRYLIEGTENLKQWMQSKADEAIAKLDGVEFDIPEPVRRIDAVIDPSGTGGIFYLPPAEDFSRPGQMVWSVPAGVNQFHTWQELTTVYHESVPGHHLQIGQAIMEKHNLNLWRRLVCGNSGHIEGWALYAEQLMASLGYHDDPGTFMGLLDAQRLRAARVVLDIGVHLKKKTPEGNGTWDASYARHFLREHSAMDAANLNFELDRYLTWPGQAPSYALGQRLWEQLRDDALAQGQDRRRFHARALQLGSIPMTVLRRQILD